MDDRTGKSHSTALQPLGADFEGLRLQDEDDSLWIGA
jgi:hypothetical protein